MPDYIATVQRVLTNYPKAVMDNVKLWSGNLDNIHIAIGDPEPYIITADDIMEAYNIAVAYFEEDFPSPETPLGSIVENFLVVVRTPATRTTPRTSASILTDSQLLKTPILEPYQSGPERWVWQRTDIPYGPSIPGPCHLTAKWFDNLIDGEREGDPTHSPIIQWYFNRQHALDDARHAGAPIR